MNKLNSILLAILVSLGVFWIFALIEFILREAILHSFCFEAIICIPPITTIGFIVSAILLFFTYNYFEEKEWMLNYFYTILITLAIIIIWVGAVFFIDSFI